MNTDTPLQRLKQTTWYTQLQRHWLTLVLFVLLCVVLGGLSWWTQPTRYVIAAPLLSDSPESKVVQALADALARDQANVRLSILKTDDLTATQQALSNGRVELALIRSDVALPTGVSAIIDLRQFYLLITTNKDSKITQLSDLRGKRIGVDSLFLQNRELAQRILAQSSLQIHDYTLVSVANADLASAVAEKKIDAYFAITPALAGPNARVPERIKQAWGKNIVLLAFDATTSISTNVRGVQSNQIPKDYFRTEPALPSDDLDTVTVSSRIVASEKVGADQAAALTRALLELRDKRQSEIPELLTIASPVRDNPTLPVHSGTAALLDGNYKSVFEKLSDNIYLYMVLLGVLGSVFTSLRTHKQHVTRDEILNDLNAIFALNDAIVVSNNLSDIHALLNEANTLLRKHIFACAKGEIDEATLISLREAVACCHQSADARNTRGFQQT